MPWERQVNGPDWQDIEAIMKTIEEHHGCTITLMLLSDGLHAGDGLALHALAIKQGELSEELAAGIGAGMSWPCRAHRTLEGAMMELLMRIDHEALQQWWKQGEVFGPYERR